MATDALFLLVGFFLATVIRSHGLQLVATENNIIPSMSLLFIITITILFITGWYDLPKSKNALRFFQKLPITAAVFLVLGVLYFYINPRVTGSPKTILLLTALFGFVLVALWRVCYNRFLATELLKTNVVFIGTSPETIEVITAMEQEPERGFRPIGVITTSTLPDHLAHIATFPNLATLLEQHQLHPEIIAVADEKSVQINTLNTLYQQIFQQISVVPIIKLYEELFGRIPPFAFSESWFLNNLNEQEKKIYDRSRRLVDLLGAGVLAILFVATFPFVALLIKLTSRGPIFFCQTRLGQNNRTFTMYKYRTMIALGKDGSAEAHGPEFTTPNDRRITAVGGFLRRVRLDELPQWINILRGDMSFIGPRPERPEFVEQLTETMPFFALRHIIKPGLTGWAQTQQSYYGTMNENLRKLEYDLYYIKNRGPLLDLAILLKTINIVIRMGGR